jgi:Clp amino terminal domain, pathogenicity island component/Putative restriction endonuclease
MFERFTEKARRVIFFARYESSQFGIPSIETEHLLLGLLREDKALAHRFLRSSASVESIRKHIEAHTTRREKISTSVDLPLSHECKRVLAYSAEEASQLGHEEIGTQHLLLGLLREEKCFAAVLLNERGLQLALVRQELATRGVDPSGGPSDRGKLLQSKLLTYLESLPGGLGILATKSRIYVRPDDLPATPPFLYIEMLSPNDRFVEVIQRINEHLVRGLRYVWLFDPGTRHVYIATPETGLREFKGTVLRTEDPKLELPLAEVFV